MPGLGGDDFNVDLEQLDELVNGMRTFNNHAESVGEEIQQRIAQLHSAWTGEAADAHSGWQDRWDQAMEEMRDGLDQLSAATATAHRNYQQAIAANQRMWPA